jgi:hypothetical protein
MFAHSERIEADAKLFVDAGATAAGDEERRDRIKAVEDSFATFRAGGKVEGFPRLTEYIDERVARRAAEWLGILGKFGTRNQTAEDGSPSPHANSNRPTIRITAGDIERIVDEAEDALISAERGVYQRDATIVSVCEANSSRPIPERLWASAYLTTPRVPWPKIFAPLLILRSSTGARKLMCDAIRPARS